MPSKEALARKWRQKLFQTPCAQHLFTFVMCKQDKVILKLILFDLFLKILMSTPAENTLPVPTQITPSFLGILLSSISVVMSESCSRRGSPTCRAHRCTKTSPVPIGTKLVGPLGRPCSLPKGPNTIKKIQKITYNQQFSWRMHK